MSWIVGVLQGLGGLTDVASSLSGIVYQQRHANQIRRANDLQMQWMARNEQLRRDAMDMDYRLGTEGPALRVQSALAAGFDPLSARQIAGSHERRISGYLEQPIRTVDRAVGVQSYGNLTTMSNAMATFRNGTRFGKPQPQGFQNNRPVLNLGPRPPESSV
ncbi:minor structural protein [Sapovirus GV/HkKa2-1]|nr:minor structural protein [Sapovirus GV/HkKa2-1]